MSMTIHNTRLFIAVSSALSLLSGCASDNLRSGVDADDVSYMYVRPANQTQDAPAPAPSQNSQALLAQASDLLKQLQDTANALPKATDTQPVTSPVAIAPAAPVMPASPAPTPVEPLLSAPLADAAKAPPVTPALQPMNPPDAGIATAPSIAPVSDVAPSPVAVAEPVAPPIVVAPSIPEWTMNKGELISGALRRWSEGTWTVIFEATDLTCEADFSVHGTLEASITQVIDALNDSGAGWDAKFYPDMHILRITKKK